MQLVAFLAWRLGGRWMHPAIATLLGGAAWVGVVLAGAIGLAMLPLSLIGLIAYGIRALGLTPLMTAAVFARNARAAARRTQTAKGRVLLCLLGAAAAFLITLAILPAAGPMITWGLSSLPAPKGL